MTQETAFTPANTQLMSQDISDTITFKENVGKDNRIKKGFLGKLHFHMSVHLNNVCIQTIYSSMWSKIVNLTILKVLAKLILE